MVVWGWNCSGGGEISPTGNAVLEVRNWQVWVLKASWERLTTGIYGSQINNPNFGSTIYGDAGDGPTFAVPHRRGVQFYSGQVVHGSGVQCVWVAYEGRISGSGFLQSNAGADWWGASNGGAGVGLFHRLTADFAWINFSTCTAGQFAAQPPPLD